MDLKIEGARGLPGHPCSGVPVAVYIFTEKATCDGLIDKPTLIFTNLTKWCSVHNATCNPHRRRLYSGCIRWTLIRAFKRYYLTNYILIQQALQLFLKKNIITHLTLLEVGVTVPSIEQEQVDWRPRLPCCLPSLW